MFSIFEISLIEIVSIRRITGAMGKGLAALTFDKDYQKKRREQLNKKPANLHEGLARSGQGFVMVRHLTNIHYFFHLKFNSYNFPFP